MAKGTIKRLKKQMKKSAALACDLEEAIFEIEDLAERIDTMKKQIEASVGPIMHVIKNRGNTSAEGWDLLEKIAFGNLTRAIELGRR